jgi:secreted trypsin-like serine protease
MMVTLGAVDLQTNDTNKQLIGAKKIIPHPEYKEDGGFENDICLVQLSRPATITPFVGTVCLPSKSYNLSGQTLYTTGYGVTDNATPNVSSTTLQETTTFSGPGVCQGFTGPNTQICTFNKTGGVGGLATGTCFGDSGGPLVLQDGQNWVVIGIVSYGAQICAENPTVYTNVFSYMDFIQKTMRDNP